MTWKHFLSLDDAAILRDCHLTHTRGSGPGGQKRNKTSSAVRIVHQPTGLAIRAEESRSQKSNLKYAISRLRTAIALQFRHDPPLADLQLTNMNASNPSHLAAVLDHLHHQNYSLSTTAPGLHATTGALSAFICSNDLLMIEVNRQRALLQLKPLRTKR